MEVSGARAAPKVTSRVLTDPNDWTEEGYLIPHEPLRMGLRLARDALNAGALDAPWKIPIFFTWLEYFEHLIHTHHDIEEKIFFPWIATKAPIPEKHSLGHKELMPALANLRSYKDKLTAEYAKPDGTAATLVSDFQNDWAKFLTDMEDHLAEEEEDIPPIMKKHFTPEENEAQVVVILQTLGFEGNARELPWIIDGMVQWRGAVETEKWFEDHVPFPIRVLYHTLWKDTFDETYNKPFQTLKLKQKPVEEEKCTIQ